MKKNASLTFSPRPFYSLYEFTLLSWHLLLSDFDVWAATGSGRRYHAGK
mgnify:CR=1 FL=1